MSDFRCLLRALLIVLSACSTSLSEPSRAIGQAWDIEELLRLHEKVLIAHRERNVAKLLEDEAEDYVVGSRGEVTSPSKRERSERLGRYLQNTRFTTYDDSIEPIVNVSDDGTLGWVVVRVVARGMQQTGSGEKPLDFISVWIELYEKRNHRWWRIGNISNFKPPA